MRTCPVILEPIKHKYYHKDTRKTYLSVTQLLGKYKQKFEADKIASAIERQPDYKKDKKYIGLSKLDIIAKWDKECKDAIKFGNETHEIIERFINGESKLTEHEIKIVEAFSEINPIDKYKGVCPECILYSDKYSLAGTADILDDYSKDKFNVWDLKTNKKIEKTSSRSLKSPLSHLTDCNFNIYTMQLSIYAYLYELETNKSVNKLGIIWYDKKSNLFSIIPVEYLEKDVKLILNKP